MWLGRAGHPAASVGGLSFGRQRQRHTALRTLAGLGTDDFRVHWARILARSGFGLFGVEGVLNSPRYVPIESRSSPHKSRQKQDADEGERLPDMVFEFVHFADEVDGSSFTVGTSTGAPGGGTPTISKDTSASTNSRRVRASISVS